jgi:hypothetical protein
VRPGGSAPDPWRAMRCSRPPTSWHHHHTQSSSSHRVCPKTLLMLVMVVVMVVAAAVGGGICSCGSSQADKGDRGGPRDCGRCRKHESQSPPLSDFMAQLHRPRSSASPYVSVLASPIRIHRCRALRRLRWPDPPPPPLPLPPPAAKSGVLVLSTTAAAHRHRPIRSGCFSPSDIPSSLTRSLSRRTTAIARFFFFACAGADGPTPRGTGRPPPPSLASTSAPPPPSVCCRCRPALRLVQET